MQPHQADAQRLKTLGFLARGLGHDLNNLVTIILGQVELGLFTPQPGHEVLYEIRGAAREIDAQIRDFLNLVRSDARPPEDIDLDSFFCEIGEELRSWAPDGVKIAIDVDETCPPTRISADYLQRAVLNLALNGLQAMPEGGVLDIHAKRAATAGQEWVAISVRDTGAGMPAATMDYLNSRESGSPQLGSIGLGLAMAKTFVRRAGGEIRVERGESSGTTIEMRLPATVATVLLNEPAKRAGVVLVVDDEEAVLRVAKSMLERQGFSVITSRTSEEAISVVEADGPIDLLIADKSRADIVRILRRERGAIPVIYACAEPPGRDDDLGNSALLMKPFTLADLNAALSKSSG